MINQIFVFKMVAFQSQCAKKLETERMEREWIDLEPVMLSAISQTQKGKYHMVSLK